MAEQGPLPRPTMRDVAREAGVSQSLVSIVFRGAQGASETTRDRVFAAADRLGYVRNESARALRATATNTIGVAFHTRQPFHHELLDGLYAATTRTPYRILLSATSQSRSELEAVETLLAYRSDALILLGSRLSDKELARYAHAMPVVVVAHRSTAPGVDWVVSDDENGMNLAVNHLKELGHERICYLSDTDAAGGQERLDAFTHAVKNAGLGAKSYANLDGGKDETAGATVARSLLESGDLPTAIIAFNDRCALGLIDTLIRHGISIPRDLSVIGFDDSEIASRPDINLTSVHQSPAEMARFAAERAIHRLGTSNFPSLARGTVLPTSLTVRSSTGPVPQRRVQPQNTAMATSPEIPVNTPPETAAVTAIPHLNYPAP